MASTVDILRNAQVHILNLQTRIRELQPKADAFDLLMHTHLGRSGANAFARSPAEDLEQLIGVVQQAERHAEEAAQREAAERAQLDEQKRKQAEARKRAARKAQKEKQPEPAPEQEPAVAAPALPEPAQAQAAEPDDAPESSEQPRRRRFLNVGA